MGASSVYLEELQMYSIFLLVFIACSVFVKPSDCKICVGTNVSMSISRPSTASVYSHLKTMYTGCTYVDGNVEITHINSEDNWAENNGEPYSFKFLKDIEEIRGYLLIYAVHVPELPFTNLKIIRGQSLFRPTSDQTPSVPSLPPPSPSSPPPAWALFVKMTRLRELNWMNLKEIQKGNVTFQDNYDLCYEETINWEDILINGGKFTRKHRDPKQKRICHPCNPVCKAETGPTRDDRHCWGEGPDTCQKLSKVICNAACPGQRCFGPKGNQCCSAQCAGGCSGPNPTDCTVCTDFNDNGTCVSKCPEKMKYNPETYTREINPDFRFTYGTTCVKKCPASYYEDDDTCVRTCSQNKTETDKNDRKVCKRCDKHCPKVCKVAWTFNLHEKNLNELEGCTTVQGSITINHATFEGDPFLHYKPLNYSDLRGLHSIQKIYGYLKIEGNSESFTNLSFFESLEVIMGQSQVQNGHSLWIYGTSLESLGLNKLTKIESGSVLLYDNKNLCYVEDMNWGIVVQNPKYDKQEKRPAVTGNNKNATQCRIEKKICNAECDDGGCWGPGDTQCLRCRNFKLGDRCVYSCDSVSRTYKADNGTCKFCDDQCANSCTGPGPKNCDSCKHVKDGPYCKSTCPWSKYQDSTSNECKKCHKNCKDISEHPACDGPSNTVGHGGCFECVTVLMKDEDAYGECLPKNFPKSCPEPEDDYEPAGYYLLNLKARPLTHQSNTTIGDRSQAVCKRCDDQCLGCTASGNTNCKKCANFSILDNSMLCVQNCQVDTHYANDSVKQCKKCHDECRKGCSGPESTDCNDCFNFKDFMEPEETENGAHGGKRAQNNVTSMKTEADSEKFNCTAVCPGERPYKEDRQCRASDPMQLKDNRQRDIIATSVGSVIGLVVIVIIFCIAYRTQRMRKRTTEILRGMTGDVPVEPITPTDAEPNMSKLRLIKEEELRKGGVLGSGAFGTVYKGVWLPTNEPEAKIPVAIKVLREGTMASRNLESLDEAFYMASMDHPCLVRLLAVCLTQQMMLITQLMPLGCLLDYVRNNRKELGSKTLLDWCTQISRGMAYLESRRLVHRDLAARNVLVQTPKQVKITDFGLAKLLDINEDEYHAQGGRMPIKWLALESIQHRTFTHKSDVWSFGVTCWEIFTFGQRPYETVRAREVPELLEKGERLPQPSICSLEVYMITIKCWMIDPDSRPSFSELVEIFAKMARDPGRYLVIPGDKHLRLPSATAYTGGAVGGESSFECPSDDGGFGDPSISLSMQDPYLQPGSDGSTSLPPPPYTLQHNNNHTLPGNHPQYRNPPPPMSHSSNGTPVPSTPMPYTTVRPGGPMMRDASSSLPRSHTSHSRASSPPVSPLKKELPQSGLIVNLPPAQKPGVYGSHPPSLNGGVVLNPAFTGAPAGFPNARHSTTSPANLAAEPTLGATAPGSHGLQRMQSKYGNLEHAAANNAMHTRGESMASRYSSDPTHVSPTSASTPVVPNSSSRATPVAPTLNAYGGVDLVLTQPQSPLPTAAPPEIYPANNVSSPGSVPPPLPSAMPSSSSGTPYYADLGNLARDGVTILPLDEDDYLRPQSTINSANNSRDNSAGSVGKEYYPDPKYLNVATGAIGKLQEVIPPSTMSRMDQSKNKPFPANITAITGPLPQTSQRYAMGKPPLPPSSNPVSIGIDNPEYFAGPNGNPPSSPASTLSFPTSPTDSLTFLLRTPTKDELTHRGSPAITTSTSIPSGGVTMHFPGSIDANGSKQIHPVVRYHEYYNDYNGGSTAPTNESSNFPPATTSATVQASSDKQRLLSSSSSGTDSASSPIPNGAGSRSSHVGAGGAPGIVPGGLSRLSMRTRKETML